MKIAVIGLGYVGCVTAACLADVGHDVIGIDTDEAKLVKLRRGESPFYEPGLQEILRDVITKGKLNVYVDLVPYVAIVDILLVTVGTPSTNSNLDLDMSQLFKVINTLSALENIPPGKILAIRSTIPPDICEQISNWLPNFIVIAYPEFLREGSAICDFTNPSLTIYGGSDLAAMQLLQNMHRFRKVTPWNTFMLDYRSAALVKYACNAFHGLKVAFANEIGTLSDLWGGDGKTVMLALRGDTKLNSSDAYLKPGLPYGGSCLGKDIAVLVGEINTLGVIMPLLSNIELSNQEHGKRIFNIVKNNTTVIDKIGIVGLSFKEDTDDLRNSPALYLVEKLSFHDRDISVFDPDITISKIALSFHARRPKMYSVVEDLIEACNVIVVTKKLPIETMSAVQQAANNGKVKLISLV